MAIENAITWEVNRKKRGFDLTQGQYLTWNWGVSEYLPLKKDQSLLAEIGPAGYGNFQVSDAAGSDARNPGVHDKVYGAGIPSPKVVLQSEFPKRRLRFLHGLLGHAAVRCHFYRHR